jgi:signal transduction histidine kinase
MAILAARRIAAYPWPALLGLAVALLGLAAMMLSLFFPAEAVFPQRWSIEPLAYIGLGGVVVGLGLAMGVYAVSAVRYRNGNAHNGADDWSRLTEKQFETFQHDLGRPMRRILGKCREVRGVLASTGEDVSVVVHELLDEIEEQAPSFRLMMANIQVMINLETPDAPINSYGVEPSAVVSRIVDRYMGQAAEQGKDIVWWAEPEEFGLVYSDAAVLEHIIANLVDNALRYGGDDVEISVTRGVADFLVRVSDNGDGIPAHYRTHLFTRGWTPEMGRSEEKTSSGLGLYISRTLATRHGGDLAVESITGPAEGHHTTFTLTLPLGSPDAR